ANGSQVAAVFFRAEYPNLGLHHGTRLCWFVTVASQSQQPNLARRFQLPVTRPTNSSSSQPRCHGCITGGYTALYEGGNSLGVQFVENSAIGGSAVVPDDPLADIDDSVLSGGA